MAWGRFHNIRQKSADDQSSTSSDSPDCKIDEESEKDTSATEPKRKEKKINRQLAILFKEKASQSQRQLRGCQHSSWYSSPRSSAQNVSVVGPQPLRLPPKERRRRKRRRRRSAEA